MTVVPKACYLIRRHSEVGDKMKVLLVDNSTLFMEGLINLLNSYGVDVVGTAPHEDEALTKASILEPDVILINVNGSRNNRLRAIRKIKAEIPAIHIIAFADSHENLLAATQNGASGYLLTDIKGDELLKKLRRLERGSGIKA